MKKVKFINRDIIKELRKNGDVREDFVNLILNDTKKTF